jgi:Flp pilus assembly protein TadD
MRPDFEYLLDTTGVVPGLTPRAASKHWPAVLYEIGPEFGRDPEWLADTYTVSVHRARAQAAISLVNWRARVVVALDEQAHGRFEEAQVLLDEAARLAPNEPEVLFVLGDNLLRTDRAAEAATVFDRIESIAPGDQRTSLGRGWAAALQGRDAEAAEMWRPVVPYTNDAATLRRMFQVFTTVGDRGTVAELRERMRALGISP